MLSFPSTVRVFVAVQPVDGRMGIDGLASQVRSVLRADPLDGSLYVFFSRRRDRARVLYFSRNGYWLLSTRLEHGRFHLPWDAADGTAALAVESAQLMLILEGIDLRGAHHRPRWIPTPPPAAAPILR